MSWTSEGVLLPLDQPPRIANMGLSLHGIGRQREVWRLPDLWCIHIYRYTAELILDGDLFEILPGHASLLPPGATLEYRYRGPSPHLYAHFSLPADADGTRVPPMQPLGESLGEIESGFQEAIGYFSTQPRRAEARLWDILWRVAERPATSANPSAPDEHPAVREARQLIERRLAEVMDVGALAAEVGISHNHLTRLFKAAVGTTVIGYIRRRRIERARHLLVHSTAPIKAIAAQVGIPDLHLFNKTMRQLLGCPPRQIRAEHS